MLYGKCGKGKHGQAAIDVTSAAMQDDVGGCFEYYAELAEKLDKRQYQSIEVPMEEFKSCVRREPLGVVALITPWNYPMLMATVCCLQLSCTGHTS